MVQTLENQTSRIHVQRSLLDEVKTVYPETKGMTYAGLVDWALRKLLANAKEA